MALLLSASLSACHNVLLYRVPLIPAQMAGEPQLQRVRINTPDKVTLDAWYAPPEKGMPLVLLFHGVKGRESAYATVVNEIRSKGFGILFAAFRGYPRSTGEPSQDGLYTDGLALFDHAENVCACDVVLVGHSLGSGVAVHTAALRRTRAVLLVSPYSSLADVAAYRFRLKPLGQKAKNEFPSMQWIGKVTEPLLVLHGELDKTIPEQFAKKLFDAASQPKRFELFKGVGHQLLWVENLTPWLDVLLKMDPAAPR